MFVKYLTKMTKKDEDLPHLVHVEVALQDPLLHGIRDLWLLGHLSNGRFHDSYALSSMVGGLAQHWGRAGHGAALGTRSEVVREVVAFAIWIPNVAIALPNVPHRTCTEAESSSEWGCWIAGRD